MSAPRAWVVVAWLETASDGTVTARACTWLRRGMAADVQRASAWARAECPSGRVYVYPTTEREPLIRARREILEGVKACCA